MSRSLFRHADPTRLQPCKTPEATAAFWKATLEAQAKARPRFRDFEHVTGMAGRPISYPDDPRELILY